VAIGSRIGKFRTECGLKIEEMISQTSHNSEEGRSNSNPVYGFRREDENHLLRLIDRHANSTLCS
jgi:hypothetical protein